MNDRPRHSPRTSAKLPTAKPPEQKSKREHVLVLVGCLSNEYRDLRGYWDYCVAP